MIHLGLSDTSDVVAVKMTFPVNAPGERASSIWTRNTNYTGAAGIHNECGRGTQARESTLDKSHSSRLNKMSKQHQKEMRLLQNSMLAYTQKMQKLSMDKFPSGKLSQIVSLSLGFFQGKSRKY